MMDARCCDLKRLEYDSVCPARSCDHKRGRKPCATEPVEESRDMRCASVRMHHWQELQGARKRDVARARARARWRHKAACPACALAACKTAQAEQLFARCWAAVPRLPSYRRGGCWFPPARRHGRASRSRPPDAIHEFLLLEYPKVKLFDFFSF